MPNMHGGATWSVSTSRKRSKYSTSNRQHFALKKLSHGSNPGLCFLAKPSASSIQVRRSYAALGVLMRRSKRCYAIATAKNASGIGWAHTTRRTLLMYGVVQKLFREYGENKSIGRSTGCNSVPISTLMKFLVFDRQITAGRFVHAHPSIPQRTRPTIFSCRYMLTANHIASESNTT